MLVISGAMRVRLHPFSCQALLVQECFIPLASVRSWKDCACAVVHFKSYRCQHLHVPSKPAAAALATCCVKGPVISSASSGTACSSKVEGVLMPSAVLPVAATVARVRRPLFERSEARMACGLVTSCNAGASPSCSAAFAGCCACTDIELMHQLASTCCLDLLDAIDNSPWCRQGLEGMQ